MDSELIKALNIHSVALERNTRALAIQHLESRKSPTNGVYGMYYFNQGASSTLKASWHQLLPRNMRRQSTQLLSLNQTLFISSSDNLVDINTLINAQANGWLGAIDGCAEITLTTGVGIIIPGSDAIYAASLTGAGSNIEQAAYLSWVETIFSSASADPREHQGATALNTPGLVEKLTPGLMPMDGDVQASFTREGVR